MKEKPSRWDVESTTIIPAYIELVKVRFIACITLDLLNHFCHSETEQLSGMVQKLIRRFPGEPKDFLLTPVGNSMDGPFLFNSAVRIHRERKHQVTYNSESNPAHLIQS